jgi:hypothetical protein
MDKLHSAGWRLHGCGLPPGHNTAPRLLDEQGHTRALVLGLARPADWAVLARVWQGVQQDWALPAPAIAVSGQGALQLWFSLAEAVPAAQGAAFLAALQQNYLADITAAAPARVQAWPAADAQAPGCWAHAPHWPGQAVAEDRWSAFTAPDLAPVFEAEPWLDVPPSPDGQADLLVRLHSLPADDFQRVLDGLQVRAAQAPANPALAVTPPASASAAAPQLAGPFADARQFLLAVVNDPSAPLAQRIDAAKVLLAHPATA